MRNKRDRQWAARIEARCRQRGVRLSRRVLDELVEHLHDLYVAELDAGHSEQTAASTIEQVIDEGRYGDVSRAARAHRQDSRLLPRASVNDLFSGIVFDVRYAFRALLRQLPFSGAVIAILAVCIGATTAAYGVINATLLRPFPYPSVDRLVIVKHGSAPNESRAFAAGDWLEYASRRSLDDLAAYSSWPMNLTGSGEPERLRSVIVSGSFFKAIGVAAAKGRTTLERDDSPEAPPVVVLSDAFWRRRYGGDPSILGRTLTINSQPATVVGVMPATFAMPDGTVDLWMPMGLSPAVRADHSGEWLSLIGRLPTRGSTRWQRPISRPSLPASPSRTHAPAGTAASSFDRCPTNFSPGAACALAGRPGRRVRPGRGACQRLELVAGTGDGTSRRNRRPGRSRRRPAADRPAIADRKQPLRCYRRGPRDRPGPGVPATVLGSAHRAHAARRPGAARCVGHDRRNRRVRVGRSLHRRLHCLAHRATDPVSLEMASSQRVVRSAPLQRVMLALQVAFAMVLVTGAALIARAYIATVHTDAGFDTSHTQTMQMTLSRSQYPDNASQIRFAESALQALRALPGVIDTGLVSDLPFEANATHFAVMRRGETDASARMMTIRMASPGFFTTLRIPVIAGRVFNEHDRAQSVAVAVVNRSGADRLGSSRRTIGQPMRVAGDVERVVIGIVGDIKHAGLHEDGSRRLRAIRAEDFRVPELDGSGCSNGWHRVARISGQAGSRRHRSEPTRRVAANDGRLCRSRGRPLPLHVGRRRITRGNRLAAGADRHLWPDDLHR